MPDIGFKPVPSSNKFPTVGFPGAEFQLVMIGSQSDYTFTVNPPVSGISVDSNGTVKLHSKPSSTVRIQAQHISSNVNYFYEFTISKWFRPQSGTYTYASAESVCGSANMITRSDFTNSPIAAVGINTNWIYKHNYGSRAIDGSLYGEWGHMVGGSGGTYPNSNWQNNRYWTGDINENHSPNVNKNFFVHSNDGGYISDEWADNGSLGVVCK